MDRYNFFSPTKCASCGPSGGEYSRISFKIAHSLPTKHLFFITAQHQKYVFFEVLPFHTLLTLLGVLVLNCQPDKRS